MKREPRSLLKAGKQPLSKEHPHTCLPALPVHGAVSRAQGHWCANAMGSKAGLLAYLGSWNRESSRCWRFPLCGGSAGHALSHERERQTAFCRLCAWEITQGVFSRSSVRQIMCVRPLYWLGKKGQDGAVEKAHQMRASSASAAWPTVCFPRGSSEK